MWRSNLYEELINAIRKLRRISVPPPNANVRNANVDREAAIPASEDEHVRSHWATVVELRRRTRKRFEELECPLSRITVQNVLTNTSESVLTALDEAFAVMVAVELLKVRRQVGTVVVEVGNSMADTLFEERHASECHARQGEAVVKCLVST